MLWILWLLLLDLRNAYYQILIADKKKCFFSCLFGSYQFEKKSQSVSGPLTKFQKKIQNVIRSMNSRKIKEKLFSTRVWNYMSNDPQFSKYIWIVMKTSIDENQFCHTSWNTGKECSRIKSMLALRNINYHLISAQQLQESNNLLEFLRCVRNVP